MVHIVLKIFCWSQGNSNVFAQWKVTTSDSYGSNDDFLTGSGWDRRMLGSPSEWPPLREEEKGESENSIRFAFQEFCRHRIPEPNCYRGSARPDNRYVFYIHISEANYFFRLQVLYVPEVPDSAPKTHWPRQERTANLCCCFVHLDLAL